MKIIKYKNTPSIRKQIAGLFKQGKIIVYPTETAYGIGADAKNKKAIKKIYKIKKRAKAKPLLLIASSLYQVQKYCVLNEQELALAKKHWPGAFSLILRMKRNNNLALGYKEVGIRVSGLHFARLIARHLGNPIISTSANISGKESPYSIEPIIRDFEKRKYQPDYIIDAGTLPERRLSRIVKVEEGRVRYLR
jgi:L-threonylcarbamoyladenylate synthase